VSVSGNYQTPMNQTQQHKIHVSRNFSLTQPTAYSDIWNITVYMDGKKYEQRGFLSTMKRSFYQALRKE
jgi:hypothetical protein